jgi:hypothetical protein
MPYVIGEPKTNEIVKFKELTTNMDIPTPFSNFKRKKSPKGKLENEELWWNKCKPQQERRHGFNGA